jgi:hypothetical protein
MSEWNEFKPDKDSISFSNDGKEMHIYFDSNYSGAIYLCLKVEDVKKALLELTTPKTPDIAD